jgi:cytosine/adenosine deaminase-related metal-dependent hydrolase
MLHHLGPLEALSTLLIEGITSKPAEIFALNSGKIEVDREADFALVTLPDTPSLLKSIALQTILHVHTVDALYINGEKI